MCAPRRTSAPGTTRAPTFADSMASPVLKRSGTLSKALEGAPSMTRLPFMRKYSSTAFFNQALTVQPPLPSGSATRRSPDSRRSSTWSTASRRLPSISFWVRSARRSKASSIRDSSVCICMYGGPGVVGTDVAQQASPQDLATFGRQRGVAAIGELEKIFDTFAERGDARIMHAHFGFGQSLGDRGEQTGPVGADQGQLRAIARIDELDARCHLEMTQMAGNAPLRRLVACRLFQRVQHPRAQFFRT